MSDIRQIFTFGLWGILALVLLAFVVRIVGRWILSRAPKGGIQESSYIPLGGVEQWISIYGKDRNAPVLLYLHGGPGAATSTHDYVFTRKWADVYTVVTWDQRNCGKSWSAEQWDTALTYDMMMEDALELILYLRRHLGVEKVTLLGHSWGSYLGANLALEYPQLVERFIGVGQLVDFFENEQALKAEAARWVGDDREGQALLEKLSPADRGPGHFEARRKLLKKYGYDMFAGGRDYSLPLAKFFCPYYSFRDYYQFTRSTSRVYRDLVASEEFDRFSLLGRHTYQVPYYNVNGDRDFQCNYQIAGAYFDRVEAPCKKLYTMKNMTHGLLEARSKEFSRILHEIASEMKDR